jgi:hypothetical protein
MFDVSKDYAQTAVALRSRGTCKTQQKAQIPPQTAPSVSDGTAQSPGSPQYGAIYRDVFRNLAMNKIRQDHTADASPLFISMLATTIGWLMNEEELNRSVENHVAEIHRLNAMSDAELANLGITRDQITAYVFHEMIEL